WALRDRSRADGRHPPGPRPRRRNGPPGLLTYPAVRYTVCCRPETTARPARRVSVTRPLLPPAQRGRTLKNQALKSLHATWLLLALVFGGTAAAADMQSLSE